MCVSASQINSVALEPKIYYQIKFLTEFIALSLAKHSSFASRQHQKYSTSLQHSSNKPTIRPTDQPTNQPSPVPWAESHSSPCISGILPVLRYFSGKQAARNSFCCCFCFVFFFCVLLIKFIENKFGQYARIILACFVHLFGVDSNTHPHTHTCVHGCV